MRRALRPHLSLGPRLNRRSTDATDGTRRVAPGGRPAVRAGGARRRQRQLAPLPRPHPERRRGRQPGSARAVEHDGERRVGDRHSGSRLVEPGRLGRAGVSHHGHGGGRVRAAQARPVRSPRTPGAGAPGARLARLLPGPRDRRGAVAALREVRPARVSPPHEEHLRVGDPGHRRRARLRALRRPGPVCLRHGGQRGLAGADSGSADAVRMGFGLLARGVRRPRDRPVRQRGGIVAGRARQAHGGGGLADAPRRGVDLGDALRVGERAAHRDRDLGGQSHPLLRPRRPAAVGDGRQDVLGGHPDAVREPGARLRQLRLLP